MLTSVTSFGQADSNRLKLDNGIELTWKIVKFERKNHTIGYCTDNSQKYLCKIDNKKWFGSDRGNELPKNQLVKLNLKIGNKNYLLETSQMFNPNSSGKLYNRQFRIKKESGFYRLYAYFSDGAGTYTAYWKILKNSSIRELISTDEKDFEWQFEN
jgi:hypothetical protein